jgi:hypothetical protein
MLVLTGYLTVQAQTDTASWLLAKNFRFNISGGIYSQQQSFKKGDAATEILVPDFLRNRRSQEPDLAHIWGIDQNLAATDNPMGHGASFFRFHSWYKVARGLNIYGSLEVNNGGFSWGPYNTYNINFLPRYYADYKNDFRVGKIPFDVQIKVGYFENFRDREGLTIYNLDMQGIVASVSYKKLKLTSITIADLQNTIGLNIDGTREKQLSLEKIKLGNHLNTDFSIGYTKYLGPTTGNTQTEASLALYNSYFRLYSQAGYRFNDGFDSQQNYAWLLGLKSMHKAGRFFWDATIEYRYYTIGFNNGFRKESNTHYRKTDRPVGSNFTGEHIYPVSYNDRPFSQWAVFTEYNEKDWVNAFGANLNLEYALGKQFKLMGNTDFNWIKASGESLFLYPFYKAGFKVEPVKGTYLAAYVTNRTLNLDKHYTTYYALKNPSFQVAFRRDIAL